MSYIDDLAAEIHALARPGAPPPGPDELPLFRNYAVLCRALGERTTSAHVHDAWCAWAAGRTPEHPCLVPFEALPPDARARDDRFRDAIRRAASSRSDASPASHGG